MENFGRESNPPGSEYLPVCTQERKKGTLCLRSCVPNQITTKCRHVMSTFLYVYQSNEDRLSPPKKMGTDFLLVGTKRNKTFPFKTIYKIGQKLSACSFKHHSPSLIQLSAFGDTAQIFHGILENGNQRIKYPHVKCRWVTSRLSNDHRGMDKIILENRSNFPYSTYNSGSQRVEYGEHTSDSNMENWM